jgi:segregation and condensation protein B
MTEDFPLKQIIEGAILASESPLSLDNLTALFEFDPPSRQDVKQALEVIAAECGDRGFELRQLASGYRFQVKQDYADWVGRLWEERPQRYTRALLETLALIAYKQPITRGDIEEVRGVTVSTNIIRSLLEREWIRVVGHRDVPGRPAMYATTKHFLDYFNLSSLDELPTLSEIRDLDDMESRLALDEPLIEMKTLTLDDEEAGIADIEDTDLDEVANTVDTIRDNIRRAMAPTEADEVEEADENGELRLDEDVKAEPLAVHADAQTTTALASVDPGFSASSDTNLDIIRAAFAEEETVESSQAQPTKISSPEVATDEANPGESSAGPSTSNDSEPGA